MIDDLTYDLTLRVIFQEILTPLPSKHGLVYTASLCLSRESCIPDSNNFISTVFIRHIKPIHIFIIYK